MAHVLLIAVGVLPRKVSVLKLLRQTATIGLLATGALASSVEAASITYDTSAVFGRTSRDTDGDVGFLGSDTGYFGGNRQLPFQGPGLMNLGAFMVEPLSDGKTLAYDNVPFTITMTLHNLPQGPSNQPVGVDTLSIAGVLNGSLTGRYQSIVTATVNSVNLTSGDSPLPFALASFQVAPQLLTPSYVLMPGAPNYGITPLNASISVPEPASWAFFGLAGIAFGLRRTRRP